MKSLAYQVLEKFPRQCIAAAAAPACAQKVWNAMWTGMWKTPRSHVWRGLAQVAKKSPKAGAAGGQGGGGRWGKRRGGPPRLGRARERGMQARGIRAAGNEQAIVRVWLVRGAQPCQQSMDEALIAGLGLFDGRLH